MRQGSEENKRELSRHGLFLPNYHWFSTITFNQENDAICIGSNV